MARRRTPRWVREQQIAEQVRAEREAEREAEDEVGPKALPLRSGELNSIEEEAEKILAKGRRQDEGSDKTQYLSREQHILRKNREVYSNSGVPDASLISGIYKRVYNPDFGNRPKRARGGDSD